MSLRSVHVHVSHVPTMLACLLAQVLTWITTSTATVMQQVVALCSLFPAAGGPIGAAITSTISTAVNAVVPKLARFAINGAWRIVRRKTMQAMNDVLTQFLNAATSSAFGQTTGYMVQAMANFTQDFSGTAKPILSTMAPLMDQYLLAVAPQAHIALAQCDAYLNQIADVARSAMSVSACAPPAPPPPPLPPRLRYGDSWFNNAWDRDEVRKVDPNHHDVLRVSHSGPPVRWDEATGSFNSSSPQSGGAVTRRPDQPDTAWYTLPSDYQLPADAVVANPVPHQDAAEEAQIYQALQQGIMPGA